MLRTLLGAICGYAVIGLLIFGTDQIYTHLFALSARTVAPSAYFLACMLTDTVYTLAGGWLCATISRRSVQAVLGLIMIGELMGVVSTMYLWKTVPHFYSFYLLIMYPAAVWLGANGGRIYVID